MMFAFCHSLRTLLAAALLLAAVAAPAAVIYRWVDENGRTHLSDTVPEKYRKSATRVDSSQYEVSPERRREAEQAAAKDKAAAGKAGTRGVEMPATPASVPRPAKRPAQGVTPDTDCDTWQRLYRESEACFGPFRTVGGGIKPEAFEACTTIPSPEPKCGPPRR